MVKDKPLVGYAHAKGLQALAETMAADMESFVPEDGEPVRNLLLQAAKERAIVMRTMLKTFPRLAAKAEAKGDVASHRAALLKWREIVVVMSEMDTITTAMSRVVGLVPSPATTAELKRVDGILARKT